jgi:voltage-gated potassium channel Kch
VIPDRWRPDPLVLRAVLVLFAIGVVATGYFHFAEKLRWIDALYFTVTTMATVGFGDISLKDSSTFSKLFGVALMIASVANTAVIFALITDSLLKKRLVLSLGRRHIGQAGHMIVVGLGAVGLRVVEQLRARGETVVIIESQEGGRHLPAIYAKRLPAIIGDARLERTLRDAGLPRAKAILSVTSDDLANLEIGLNAKLLNPSVRGDRRRSAREVRRRTAAQCGVNHLVSWCHPTVTRRPVRSSF